MFFNDIVVPPTYYLIDSPRKIAWVLAQLITAKEFSYDLETTHPTVKSKKKAQAYKREKDILIAGISFSWGRDKVTFPWTPGMACYIPLIHSDESPYWRDKQEFVVEAIKKILETPIPKIAHNSKFDTSESYKLLGIKVRNMKYCTMLMNTLLDEENVHCFHALKSKFDLKGNVTRLGMSDYYLDTSASLFKGDLDAALNYYDPNFRRYHKVPLGTLYPYGCADSDLCLSLKHVLMPILEEEGLTSTYHKIVMPLSKSLMHMELFGCPLNIAKAEKVDIDQQAIMDEMAPIIHKIAGKEFMVSSAAQVGRILFEDLQLPGGVHNKMGGWIVDADALGKLEHPIIEPLMKYRKAQKIGSTYAKSALALVSDYTADGKIGWVHPDIRQDSKTGRLKCSDPNLTNLPRPENGGDIVKGMWECEEDYVFLFKDFSQIELRVAAHISEEPSWINGFNKGYDMHAAMAHKIWNLPCTVEEVKDLYKDKRSAAKTINFGIIYGESVWKLAKTLDMSIEEATKLVNVDYFGAAPTLKAWIDDTHEEVEKTGQVRNIFNRIRHLPKAQLQIPKGLKWPPQKDRPDCYRKCVAPKDIGMTNEHMYTVPAANLKQNIKLWKKYDHYKCCDCPHLVSCFINSEIKYLNSIKAKAMRQSVNSIVQGSAADMSSLALIDVTNELKKAKLDSRPVLYIHDELGCYTHKRNLEQADRIMEDCMVRRLRETTQFRVPLVTDTEIVHCWGDKK